MPTKQGKHAEARKVDIRAELKEFYTASPMEAKIVRVPNMNFLLVDGGGDPNGEEFHNAVDALYNASYTLKFMIKFEQSIDYPVMHLEGLWWSENENQWDISDRASWKWTAMIAQPKFVTSYLFKKALEQIREKKKDNPPPALNRVRLESFNEGLAAQIMHVGPYANEGPTIQKLRGFIRENGCELRGRHHEIYLGDPRRASPSKLKTILRQPMREA